MQSIIQSNTDECYLCQGIPTDKHHLLRGNKRKKADELGLFIHVCRRCHERIHNEPWLENELKCLAQVEFENKVGTREQFREIFGRSYI